MVYLDASYVCATKMHKQRQYLIHEICTYIHIMRVFVILENDAWGGNGYVQNIKLRFGTKDCVGSCCCTTYLRSLICHRMEHVGHNNIVLSTSRAKVRVVPITVMIFVTSPPIYASTHPNCNDPIGILYKPIFVHSCHQSTTYLAGDSNHRYYS